jgi:hypothetical protein
MAAAINDAIRERTWGRENGRPFLAWGGRQARAVWGLGAGSRAHGAQRGVARVREQSGGAGKERREGEEREGRGGAHL